MTPEELREWYINDIESKQIVIDDLQAQLSAKSQELKEQIKIHEIVLSRESTNIKLFEEELASLRSENERLKEEILSERAFTWELTSVRDENERLKKIVLSDKETHDRAEYSLRKRCEDLEAITKALLQCRIDQIESENDNPDNWHEVSRAKELLNLRQ